MRYKSFGEGKNSILDRIIAYVRLNIILKVIGRGGKILDLGCGYNGELLSHLGSGFEVYGRDLSVNPKKKYLSEGRVDTELPYPSQTFDIVTALAIIEHVDDPDRMLVEARRVMRDGGRILITTPSTYGRLPLEWMAKTGLISSAEIDDHKRYYSRETLRQAMEQAGFNDIKVRHFGILWLNLFAEGRA